MRPGLQQLSTVHGRFVHQRRISILAGHVQRLIEPGWSICDVGCGDGNLAAIVAAGVPGAEVQGFEIAPRPTAAIPVARFDGRALPVADSSFDCVTMIDVLHHTEDPRVLLREAARVSRRCVIVKDHRTSRPLARPVLRFMDWLGNAPHGVALPYNYWSMGQWTTAWQELGLEPDRMETDLGLYPWPASWLFESGLHFIARLVPRRP